MQSYGGAPPLEEADAHLHSGRHGLLHAYEAAGVLTRSLRPSGRKCRRHLFRREKACLVCCETGPITVLFLQKNQISTVMRPVSLFSCERRAQAFRIMAPGRHAHSASYRAPCLTGLACLRQRILHMNPGANYQCY